MARKLRKIKVSVNTNGVGFIIRLYPLMACDRNKMQYQLKPLAVLFGNNLWLVIVSILLVCVGANNVFPLMDSIIIPCKSGSYITIDSLYANCGLPGICGKKLACEGQTALIQGYMDYGNVFDKTTYPLLPYQKFLITNAERSKTLEVWVVSEESDAVFKKIAEKKACNPDGPVYIKGVLAGFDMPIMGACHRGLKLNLSSATSLSFEEGGGHLQIKP